MTFESAEGVRAGSGMKHTRCYHALVAASECMRSALGTRFKGLYVTFINCRGREVRDGPGLGDVMVCKFDNGCAYPMSRLWHRIPDAGTLRHFLAGAAESYGIDPPECDPSTRLEPNWPMLGTLIALAVFAFQVSVSVLYVQDAPHPSTARTVAFAMSPLGALWLLATWPSRARTRARVTPKDTSAA